MPGSEDTGEPDNRSLPTEPPSLCWDCREPAHGRSARKNAGVRPDLCFPLLWLTSLPGEAPALLKLFFLALKLVGFSWAFIHPVPFPLLKALSIPQTPTQASTSRSAPQSPPLSPWDWQRHLSQVPPLCPHPIPLHSTVKFLECRSRAALFSALA